MKRCAILLLLLTTSCRTGPEPASDLPPVDPRIRALADPDWRAREEATRSLIEEGESVVPALREALAVESDPEARARIEAVIATIERPALGPDDEVVVRIVADPLISDHCSFFVQEAFFGRSEEEGIEDRLVSHVLDLRDRAGQTRETGPAVLIEVSGEAQWMQVQRLMMGFSRRGMRIALRGRLPSGDR